MLSQSEITLGDAVLVPPGGLRARRGGEASAPLLLTRVSADNGKKRTLSPSFCPLRPRDSLRQSQSPTGAVEDVQRERGIENVLHYLLHPGAKDPALEAAFFVDLRVRARSRSRTSKRVCVSNIGHGNLRLLYYITIFVSLFIARESCLQLELRHCRTPINMVWLETLRRRKVDEIDT